MPHSRATLAFALASVAAIGCRPDSAGPAATQSAGGSDRTVLPIARPATPVITTLDARNATAPPPVAVTAPKGAPNVVFILIDDMGFGAPSTFGGAVPMPVMDSHAAHGLRYNQYHTTALCSPTRMAILTGRNHHTVNTGAIMEIATAFTGNTGIRPLETTPFAEILRQNGYSTPAFGKYHETPPGK
jgi:arylsulfatase